MAVVPNQAGARVRPVAQAREAAAPRDNAFQWSQVLVWLVLGVGAVLMVAPFYYTLISSFKTTGELRAFPPTFWPQTWTLEHWGKLNDLTFGSFPAFFRNSLFVVSVITVLTLLTSAAAGYVFAKFRFPGARVLFWLVLALLMVPFSVTIVPLYGMMTDWDWRNNYASLIVPIIFNPFGIFLMRQFIKGLPDELLDAARIDGASEWGIFFRVVLPAAGTAS